MQAKSYQPQSVSETRPRQMSEVVATPITNLFAASVDAAAHRETAHPTAGLVERLGAQVRRAASPPEMTSASQLQVGPSGFKEPLLRKGR